MLALYPSNKLEHLSVLLATVLKQGRSDVFAAETILVESPGMQHWLNMALARQQGLAMNITYPLPVRFMWNTARSVLGEDIVPKKSPYRREVLIWRIDRLLSDESMLQHHDMQEATTYWQKPVSEDEKTLQRMMLAMKFADVIEQYLLYRPQWLFAWEQGQNDVTGNQNERWQACIWRALVAENPLHPARLHKDAVEALQRDPQRWKSVLPSRVTVFAINTMAPQFVAFLDALAGIIDIHLFHLNPSVNYWGNAASKGAQAKQLREQGIAAFLAQEQNNSLLANLGKQGRDLFNQLSELESFEVSAFDTDIVAENGTTDTLLQQVQEYILHAQEPVSDTIAFEHDNSIVISRSHSNLREVQCLHDYLLEQLENDPYLKPSDIVVMCPAIESYAPFIDAVFHRVGVMGSKDSKPPRIPCSISDRSPLDAEPLIAAFIDLLSLPDSRFTVNGIIDYLRLPALQKRFSLSEESLTLLMFWLERACVHWGINSEHKKLVSDGACQQQTHSWEWGISRLIQGMASADSDYIIDDIVTVPDVEGQHAMQLGRLMLVLEQFQYFSTSLRTPRSPSDWYTDLLALRDSCFSPLAEQLNAWESIAGACAELKQHCEQAGYDQDLSLRQVREMLTTRFGSPDAGNHFMTGQVTFCSMLPMRSIPFKVVAILGLNDGDFPRQNQPNSIDIMSRTPAKIGDRSRRQEDRYLFLEAIISARHTLYLSYQGNSAVDNSERQPSLVLQEFMEHLQSGFDWEAERAVRQQALHPFSINAFAQERSFEAGWFRLAQSLTNSDRKHANRGLHLEGIEATHQVLSAAELASYFDDPLAKFAKRQLDLHLEVQAQLLEDAEPFSADSLLRYQALDSLTDHYMQGEEDSSYLDRLRLSGVLPNTPLQPVLLDQWDRAARLLHESLTGMDANAVSDKWQSPLVDIVFSAGVLNDDMVLYHHGSATSKKRRFSHWLTLLAANACGYHKALTVLSIKWEKGEPVLVKQRWNMIEADVAQELLTTYVQAYAQIETGPVLYHLAIGEIFCSVFEKSEPEMWQTSVQLKSKWRSLTQLNSDYAELGNNAYFQWFYPDVPELSELDKDTLLALYMPYFQAAKVKRK